MPRYRTVLSIFVWPSNESDLPLAARWVRYLGQTYRAGHGIDTAAFDPVLTSTPLRARMNDKIQLPWLFLT
jgi:hypothetical protein